MHIKPFLSNVAIVSAVLGLAGLGAGFQAADVNPYDQSGVPLEVQPTDPSLAKIVVVAGRLSHGAGEHEFFAGSAVLMKLLQQTPGVFPVMVRDGWPKDPRTFEGAKALVFYMDGGARHPIIQGDHLTAVKKMMDSDVGLVNLHYAVEYPKEYSDLVLSWLGGYYETGYSTNPHWLADFKALPEHPITRGVKPFTSQDEWYFNIRFTPDKKSLTPILRAVPSLSVEDKRLTPAAKKHLGREEVLAWAYERGSGGRSFGFTGGHFHKNWGDENFRRLVTNAILWSARVEVPKGGARVELDPAELNKNLDRKEKKK